MKFVRRRALASIVTSAILLSSIAIMGVGLVGWSNSNLMGHQKTLESTFSKNINKLNEHVIFEKVWFGGISPNKFVNVTATNSGDIGLNVTSIQFINSTTFAEISSATITDGGISSSQSYSVQIDYEWETGDEFDILLKSNRDNQFRTQVSP